MSVYYTKAEGYISFYLKTGRLLFSYYPADRALLIDKVPAKVNVGMAYKKTLANVKQIHMLIHIIFDANETEFNDKG